MHITREQKKIFYVNSVLTGLLVPGFAVYSWLVCGFQTYSYLPGPNLYPDWMKHHQATPLSSLVLPGTHDSLIYEAVDISQDYDDSNKPALVEQVQKLRWVPGLNYKINRWTQTQTSNLYQQLMHGIRCFDIRIVSYSEKVYGIHSFVSSDFALALIHLLVFLREHPNELVFLRYLSNSTLGDARLLAAVGSLLISPSQISGSPVQCTVGQLLKHGNIVLLCANPVGVLVEVAFPDFIHHDWKNTFDAEEKINHVTQDLESHSDLTEMFNLDWTLTPQATQVLVDPSDLLVHAQRFNQQLACYWQRLSSTHRNKIRVVSVDNEASFSLYEVLYNRTSSGGFASPS